MEGFDLSTISDVYVGSTQYSEIYYGSNKVWPTDLLYSGFCRLTLNDDSVVELQGSGELSLRLTDPYKSRIVSAEIGKLCTSIGDYAFLLCPLLENIDIASNCTSIGFRGFLSCELLTITDTLTNIISIGSYAFYGCKLLEIMDLPNCTQIGDNIFQGCSSLKSVNLQNITSLGNSTFNDCLLLENVNVLKCTQIGSYAFCNCTSLSSLTIDWTKITSIKNRGFFNCSLLMKNQDDIVDLCNCTEIGDYAFQSCYFNKVKLTGMLLFVYPLYGCRFKQIEFNENLTNIPVNFLYGNTNLQTINGVGNVTEITDNAFRNCSSLVSCDFSDKVLSIGSYAFNNCSLLIHVTKNNNILTPTTIKDRAFDLCVLLETSVDITNATLIDTAAFSNCTNIVLIGTLNSEITTLGNYVFYRANLSGNFDVHEYCTSIGGNCFANITTLQSIKFYSNNPPTCLYNSLAYSTFEIRVPQAALETYKTADGFSNVASRIVGY